MNCVLVIKNLPDDIKLSSFMDAKLTFDTPYRGEGTLYLHYTQRRLVPLPEKKPVNYMNYWFVQGYNACLEEIKGEEEE